MEWKVAVIQGLAIVKDNIGGDDEIRATKCDDGKRERVTITIIKYFDICTARTQRKYLSGQLNHRAQPSLAPWCQYAKKITTRKPPKVCPTVGADNPASNETSKTLWSAAEDEDVDEPVPPSWWGKYKDLVIRIKGKEEAETQRGIYGCRPLQEGEIDYVLDELEGFAVVRDTETGIESDSLIEYSLRDAPISSVATLENVLDAEKDWNPRAHEQPLDLVHPSLYCIVYGHSKSAESLGYINSIHPINYPTLHTAIETLVARFIPLRSRVLLESKEDYKFPSRTRTGYGSHDWEPTDLRYHRLYSFPDILTHEQSDAMEEAWKAIRGMRTDAPQGGKVQVIVKLVNILLSPSTKVDLATLKASRMNASSQLGSTITSRRTSHKAKCPSAQVSVNPRAIPRRGCSDLGFKQPLNQVVTDVPTKAGCCIAFPNMYQHRVSPFPLVDPSKPVYRKIITFPGTIEPKIVHNECAATGPGLVVSRATWARSGGVRQSIGTASS
ncbi:hypothetical protein IW261DRAFT_1420821 [Armillaria novae-zelandiae]|uniref:DUF4246 domain-containing protein n=1 Tax=Armillaria novae-zelandiae TaxID=153914 RepID=A0AA39P620_9AGAR|nr:hypothetical protein IW261DRAFT_1420821 [Armillaria novae-zelandiae]